MPNGALYSMAVSKQSTYPPRMRGGGGSSVFDSSEGNKWSFSCPTVSVAVVERVLYHLTFC